jgi:hypothetical protein
MLLENLAIGSVWRWERWHNGILLRRWQDHNLCTLEGRNHILDAVFAGATQISTWYVVPFEDNHTPAAGDTYAVPGFTESTAYDETTRPQWQNGSVAAGVISNTLIKASFAFNALKTIYGGALVGGGTDGPTKNDQAGGGALFCASQFSGGAEAVMNGSTLKVTIEINLLSS